jgi:CHAT domain-containing protein
LTAPKKSSVTPAQLAEDLLAAAASQDEEKFRQLALNNFMTAFNLGREDFLDKYLEARVAEDQTTAAKYLDVIRRTARLAKEEKAEHYLNDLVTFVAAVKQPVIEKVIEIRALLKQSDQSHERGKYDEANSSYEKALVLADRISDICHAEQARYGLARINIHKIETPERQLLREELVRETGRRNHKVLFARGLLSLANAYGAAQLLTKSLQADITAYQVAWALGDIDTAVNGLRFSGRAYVNLGDYENAVFRSFQAIQTLSEHPIGPLRECQSYVQIAEALDKARHSALAVAYQQEALKYCSQTGNLSLLIAAKGGLGLYHTLIGQYQRATELFQECLSELEKYDDRSGQDLLITELSILLGDSYVQQTRNEDAAAMYQKALNSVIGTGQRKYLVMAHQGLATAFLRQSRNVEAEKELLISIKLAEKIRKNINDATHRGSFRGRRLGIYRTMTEFQFVARNNLEKAFYYAELSRNRELFDVIATQSEIRWDSNQATLDYAASDEVLDLKRIQSILPDNAQLVEYAITDRHLLVWLVTNGFWKSYSIPIGDQQLRQLCAEYLAELQDVRNAEALSDKAAVLHNELIKPLAGDLNPNKILVIVPDGILGAIPFPALFSAESRRYLIQDYAVATIPSAGILAHILKIRQTKLGKQPDSLLVLSNPKLDAKQFPSLKTLPATEREAAGISSRYAASLSLSREQATKSMLLRNIDQYSVIHLATHSIVNEQNPLLSSVILSPDGQSPDAAIEGNLRAFEIFGLQLTRPRLVILSSCRSGLNVQSASNGLGGLAHAFFKAGVPAVIASLWEVEDQSAAEMMKSFHYFHRVEKQSFCQALRSAQLQMLNRQEPSWKHPYYWAAFQFSGNGFTS